uniref:Uncharacterized protein n=1 Tax=Rhizophora mucronata TaxID=61149 RepID=A0A2P2PRD1_RHIMU
MINELLIQHVYVLKFLFCCKGCASAQGVYAVGVGEELVVCNLTHVFTNRLFR